MRVFASWSGKTSQEVATIFKKWIPNVLQDIEVYVSSQDIEKGDRWLANVNSTLQDTNFGISVITAANATAPWILYEAGAIAKSLGEGRLIPVLCGVQGFEIPNHPLTQFQYIKAPDAEQLLALVVSLNEHVEKRLPEDRLKETFRKWYPDFLEDYKKVSFAPPPAKDVEADPVSTLVLPMLESLMKELRDLKMDMQQVKAGAQYQLSQALISEVLRSSHSKRDHTISAKDLSEFAHLGTVHARNVNRIVADAITATKLKDVSDLADGENDKGE
ncbi:toll/interleukin-1 receptor domain-containing protein [Rhizobium sp. YS-1r]|uniref:toll/interleukin-1 receptor domain-containing protein n=1 Tax=Rhizobium sp. YS-1r TaxID=1532558 RepID=UPI00068E14E3|nr:toll/interleukin-1 receptor domain-containing protein [Rhizobium sp. YS-1r]